MCLAEQQLIREILVSTFNVDTTAAVQLVGASAYRVGLTFGVGDTNSEAVVANTTPPGAANGFALLESAGLVSFTWRDHSRLVQLPWFGVAVLGNPTIWVAEFILPSEFWPILIGKSAFVELKP